MRIIEVIPSLKVRAGAEVFAVDLCCELKEKGNEVLFVCLYDEIDKSFADQLASCSVNVVFCKKQKGLDLACSRIFKRIVKDFSPDIIHAHLGCLATYYLAFGFKKCKWHFAQTIHNIAERECDKVNKFLKKRYTKRGLLTLIGISKTISESIIALYKCKPITVYNGVRLSNIVSNNYDITFDIVCVARFSIQKNHKLLMEAIHRLINNYNYPNLRCVCVGDGPLLVETIDYSKKLGINDNIQFVGKKNDVLHFLKKSKIFVLSSLYEGNPISALEAMNAGLPVVAPRVGGIPDIIKNRLNGIIYNVNDVEGLVVSLKTLLDDDDLRSKISIFNKKDVQQYSIEHCAEEYNLEFLRMLSSK